MRHCASHRPSPAASVSETCRSSAVIVAKTCGNPALRPSTRGLRTNGAAGDQKRPAAAPASAPSSDRPDRFQRRQPARLSASRRVGHIASIRSTARRAATATSGSTVTSWRFSSRAARMLASVIRFICGQRLQGRMNSTSGVMHRDVVAHRALGEEHDPGWPLLPDEIGHHRGRSGKVRLGHDIRRTFRVCQHRHAGIVFAQLPDVIGREQFMDLAMTMPGKHLDLRFARDVAGRDIRPESSAHAARRATRRPVWRFPMCSKCPMPPSRPPKAIHIGDNRHAGIALAQQRHILRRDRIRQRATPPPCPE